MMVVMVKIMMTSDRVCHPSLVWASHLQLKPAWNTNLPAFWWLLLLLLLFVYLLLFIRNNSFVLFSFVLFLTIPRIRHITITHHVSSYFAHDFVLHAVPPSPDGSELTYGKVLFIPVLIVANRPYFISVSLLGKLLGSMIICLLLETFQRHEFELAVA